MGVFFLNTVYIGLPFESIKLSISDFVAYYRPMHTAFMRIVSRLSRPTNCGSQSEAALSVSETAQTSRGLSAMARLLVSVLLKDGKRCCELLLIE